ncbi:Frag1/DRAM/Sfk1 family-containing protein [Strongyloides ratti]|uniref:Frag1/DRAM/Sfk1 family-containing protein n=1 Tax=Strongyloides ratti TaxID=34506 RepID=A0A090KWQ8_STRRB|nr:Frag1/DRAM/Sfk1 family-containing protein [Strongyloides ratti]CEF60287.1 Frag1/DRAM/Sfk1 family-containing protein [Strongyloides ratti]
MKKLWLLPVLHVTFACLAFFSGYIIIVAKNLVSPLLPYISDGGAYPPESGVFGQFLNIAAAILGIVVYVRYQQLEIFYNYNKTEDLWKKFNITLLIIGWLSSFGMSIVANFQEYSVPMMHIIGAMLSFFGGILYVWGHIFLTIKKKPKLTPKWLFILRIILGILSLIFLIFHLITQWTFVFVEKDSNGLYPTLPSFDKFEEYPKDSPFYARHLVTTFSEWILVLSLEAHFFSYSFELKDFMANIITVEYRGITTNTNDRFDIRTNKIIRRQSDIFISNVLESF